MDLTTCSRCGMDVEASATTCPNCGVVDPGGRRNISPAAFAILSVVGILFVLIMTTDLGPTLARRWFRSPEQLARARGDSLARVLTPAAVHDLDATDLRSVATADSGLAPATIRAAQLEVAAREAAERRRVAAEQKANETWRINSIASDAKASCGRGSLERADRLVRAHADWSDQDLIKVVCREVWVGMSADQLRAAWGSPQAISSTSTGFQSWMYSAGTFVYLEGSFVTSWQTLSTK